MEVGVDGLLVALLVACGVLAGLAGSLVVRRWTSAPGALLEQRLTGFSADLDRRLESLDRRLWTGLDMVQHGQAEASSVAAEVRERIAQLGGTAQQVLEQGRELGKLGDLLRPPQARGAFGELLLEQVLAQGLPPGAWRTQHGFRSGARVDAVITVGDHLVPVDAKFPLEAFARMAELGMDDASRVTQRRAFMRDARKHVDAIADKYICPDEGTLDFALCYVPSEAVYYEFLREDQAGESAFRYALARRVFPVSPTTLYTYLLSVGVGLRGLRVQANARRILEALQGLAGDLERFRGEFEVVGRHLNNARGKWDEAARRLDGFGARLGEVAERVDDVAEHVDPTGDPDSPQRTATVASDPEPHLHLALDQDVDPLRERDLPDRANHQDGGFAGSEPAALRLGSGGESRQPVEPAQ
jgi:DNA recombination protein RmuC